MLILLSPAKSLDIAKPSYKKFSHPRMSDESLALIGIMKTKSAREIAKLMSISDKLAQLNRERYISFSHAPTPENVKQAILAFKGDVYIGLENDSLKEKDLAWAQDHVRILSGLYGVLRPLDVIQPYRLEMGTQLKNPRGKDLYAFWGTRITDFINEDLKKSRSEAIINLASQEYFAAVKPELLKGHLYHVNFLEKRDGKYKFISFTAKKARGWMCRYLIDQRATNPEEMKEFKGQGFRFTKSLSSEHEYVFTRTGK
ncbi:MAG TPA: peroxide stress protein YaaA [Saprospiraceae bacterium]|nr:peroxide stress protein YaaA [Saprospiraceae bacterium]